MKMRLIVSLLLIGGFVFSAQSQNPQDVLNFDETLEGPWSDIAKTTISIPKVANGSVKLDGAVSSVEYGGFQAIPVEPGVNAWILNFATTKDWKSQDDSSFSFYAAYDDNFLYVGVDVKDDVVRSNDPNAQFWKDDAVEILIDPLNTRYDYNYDSTNNYYGGHVYFNYEGRFSPWDDSAGIPRAGQTLWSSLAEWYYGEDKEVYGFGKESANGWIMEMKFHKMNFEDPESDFKWVKGEDIAFNIGLDDDDGADLALQYWWANRARAKGANPDSDLWGLLTEEEINSKAYLDPNSSAALWDVGIDAAGRLSPAGAGVFILGEMAAPVREWNLY
ncbi:MAG: sugar-binding protein [Candidatus Omnitrophota bacterium]